MRKASTLLTVAAILFMIFSGRPALAGSGVAIGVNIFDEGAISQAEQDAERQQLENNGVKTIRTGLGNSSLYVITEAFKHGIGTVAIVYPFYGSKAKSKGSWSQVPLSEVKPEEFRAWFQPMVDKLEASGVRLAAVEFGNEINTSGYNGDIPKPGSGRVLGISDLNNPKDAEGAAIASSFHIYLQLMATLKDMLHASRLNKATPILSAGLADWGLPGHKSWNNAVGVSIPDTIEFLRQNGLDNLADGYGVHVYPSSDPRTSVAARTSQLSQDILAACKPGRKPCWVTEWGISNPGHICPNPDGNRVQAIKDQREAFKAFADEGRLAAIIYFPWTGFPGPQVDPNAIFRCGQLSNSGKIALSPL
ncbi:MAG: hypothetical protein ABSG88_17165 [Bradyrhizobium sp.]